jgi:hypothetical protein
LLFAVGQRWDYTQRTESQEVVAMLSIDVGDVWLVVADRDFALEFFGDIVKMQLHAGTNDKFLFGEDKKLRVLQGTIVYQEVAKHLVELRATNIQEIKQRLQNRYTAIEMAERGIFLSESQGQTIITVDFGAARVRIL